MAAAIGLFLAAAIVGVAIVIGGSTARALNGVGAIVWLASGVALAWSLPEPARRGAGWLAAIAAGLVLGILVRPGTLAPAIVSFAIAGAIVVLVAGDRTAGWALLAPAIYLPVHLIYGIGKAVMRSSGMRVDPPPTAAILPLVMLIAAAAGGAVAAMIVRRGTGAEAAG
jgi:hypothetical protein